MSVSVCERQRLDLDIEFNRLADFFRNYKNEVQHLSLRLAGKQDGQRARRRREPALQAVLRQGPQERHLRPQVQDVRAAALVLRKRKKNHNKPKAGVLDKDDE